MLVVCILLILSVQGDLSDQVLLTENQTIALTTTYSGSVSNVSFTYRNCTIAMVGGQDYVLSLMEAVVGIETIMNVNVTFQNCTFVAKNYVFQTAITMIMNLHIQFIDCSLDGTSDSLGSLVFFDLIGASTPNFWGITFSMDNVVMTNGNCNLVTTTTPSPSPFVTNMILDIRNSNLQPLYELITYYMSQYHLQLTNVTLETWHLESVAPGSGNNTIEIVNCTITEVYETIIKLKAWSNVTYIFEDSVLILAASRNANGGDAGLISENVFIDLYDISYWGCVPKKKSMVLCTWSFTTGSCTNDDVDNYPCSGISVDNCVVTGDPTFCSPSTTVNTTIHGIVPVGNNKTATTVSVADWLGCNFTQYRLVYTEYTDIESPLSPRIVIMPCNTSSCNYSSVVHGSVNCSCSLPLANASFVQPGIWYPVDMRRIVNDSALTVYVVDDATQSPLASTIFGIEVEVQCRGSCLAACESRQHVNILFRGNMEFIVQGDGTNPLGILVDVKQVQRVSITFESSLRSGRPCNLSNPGTIRFEEAVYGVAAISLSDTLVQSSTTLFSANCVFAPLLLNVTVQRSFLNYIFNDSTKPAVADWSVVAPNSSLNIIVSESQVFFVCAALNPCGFLGLGSGGVLWRRTVMIAVSAAYISLRNGSTSSVVVSTILSSNLQPGLMPLYNLGTQFNLSVVNSTFEAVGVILFGLPSQVLPFCLRDAGVISLCNVTFLAPILTDALVRVVLMRSTVMATLVPYWATLAATLKVTIIDLDVKIPAAHGMSVNSVIILHLRLFSSRLSRVSVNIERCAIFAENATTPLLASQDPTLLRAVEIGDQSQISECHFHIVDIWRFPYHQFLATVSQKTQPFSSLVGVTYFLLGNQSTVTNSSAVILNGPDLKLNEYPGKLTFITYLFAPTTSYFNSSNRTGSLVNVTVSAACLHNPAVVVDRWEYSSVNISSSRVDTPTFMSVGHSSMLILTITNTMFLPASVRASDLGILPGIALYEGCNVPSSFLSWGSTQIRNCPSFNDSMLACPLLGSSQSMSHSVTPSLRYSISSSYNNFSRTWTTSSSLSHSASPSTSVTRNATGTVPQFPTYSLEGTNSLSLSITASKGSASSSVSIVFLNRPSQLFVSVSSNAATVDSTFTIVSIPIAMLVGSTVMVNFTAQRDFASMLFGTEAGSRRTPITFDSQCSLHPIIVPYVSNSTVLVVTFGPLDGKFNVYGGINDCVMSIGPDSRYINAQEQGTLKIIIRGSPMTPTISKSVTTAIGTTTGVLALISMNPVAASTQSRVLMLTSLTVCAYAQDDQSYSFLGIGLAGEDYVGFFYRGAIVGNIALFAGFVVVLKFMCALVAKQISWKSRTVFTPLLDEVEGILHFPGAAMAPAALLLQPTLSAGVALLVVGSGPLDVSLGVLSVVFCLSMVLYFSVTILVMRPTTLSVVKRSQNDTPQSSAMEKNGKQRLKRSLRIRRNMSELFHGSLLMRYVKCGYHWESSDARGTLWKHKHLQMFSDTSLLWCVVVSMCGDVVVAVLNGVSSMGNDTMCLGQLVVMMILYVTQLVLHLLLVPSLSMLVHLSLVVTTFMSVACAVLVLIGVTTTSTSTQVVVLDANAFLTMMISLVTSCQSLPLLIDALTSLPVVFRNIMDLALIAGSGSLDEEDSQSVLMVEYSSEQRKEDTDVSFGNANVGFTHTAAERESSARDDIEASSPDEPAPQKPLLPKREEYYFVSQIDGQLAPASDSRLKETSVVDAVQSSMLLGGPAAALDFLQIAEEARQDALTHVEL